MFGFNKKVQLKVLVVEDDALLAQALMQHLLKEKFDVVTVGNGLEVADVVKTFIPNIILLDIILPGLDGFGVLKLLRAKKKTKSIPVIIISNIGEVGDIKSAKALGAKDYIIKANTRLSTIVKTIRKYV